MSDEPNQAPLPPGAQTLGIEVSAAIMRAVDNGVSHDDILAVMRALTTQVESERDAINLDWTIT